MWAPCSIRSPCRSAANARPASPDLVVEGDGYTLEFIGPTLLWLDIQDPSGMARLLAEPVKGKLPIGV